MLRPHRGDVHGGAEYSTGLSVTRVVQGPDGELAFDIRETYFAEGDTLTLERRQGTAVQTLVYHRK